MMKKHDPRTCENSIPCIDCELAEGTKQKGEKPFEYLNDSGYRDVFEN